jgi:ribosomal protein L13E
VLGANGRKVQEGKFVRKGVEYWLELNEFFDTIRQNKTELALRIEIRKAKESGLLGSIDVVHFEAETKIPQKIVPTKPREESQEISPVQALVRCRGKVSEKKGKGFSREEVISAGMNLKDIHLLNIPYDRRRKSCHSRNINALKILKEKRIVARGDEHAA